MIRLSFISVILAAQAAAGQSILEGGPEWRAKRAEVFSQVCMAAAPGFATLDARAESAGLERVKQSWVLAPEAVVNLMAHDGFCSCFLTAGAPDQEAMIAAIHARLMADWGDSYTGLPNGLASVAPFERDGVEAVSILERRKFDGQNWLEARISVFGACPGPDVDAEDAK
ncbi:hypothetical protein [Maliponia aquimaris]|uniref:Uncharacterized protein n=1 Tax=Maliponia aquimaris TaxID=1673631 RepID=A0A238K140_9RHOB|nr:hypothetical protein [Maliponia aquimaris]SMX36595.1 hypothetical protein MAA8898_00923 [Maliponia aquimaris]